MKIFIELFGFIPDFIKTNLFINLNLQDEKEHFN